MYHFIDMQTIHSCILLVKRNDPGGLAPLSLPLADKKSQMSQNFLQLNEGESEDVISTPKLLLNFL